MNLQTKLIKTYIKCTKDIRKNNFGDDPDEFRYGGLYAGVGGFQLGVNSEGVRHAIQNKFAHDFIPSKGLIDEPVPHFAIDKSKNPTRFHWNIGTGTGSTLW